MSGERIHDEVASPQATRVMPVAGIKSDVLYANA
jgi:hypothetical protein